MEESIPSPGGYADVSRVRPQIAEALANILDRAPDRIPVRGLVLLGDLGDFERRTPTAWERSSDDAWATEFKLEWIDCSETRAAATRELKRRSLPSAAVVEAIIQDLQLAAEVGDACRRGEEASGYQDFTRLVNTAFRLVGRNELDGASVVEAVRDCLPRLPLDEEAWATNMHKQHCIVLLAAAVDAPGRVELLVSLAEDKGHGVSEFCGAVLATIENDVAKACVEKLSLDRSFHTYHAERMGRDPNEVMATHVFDADGICRCCGTRPAAVHLFGFPCDDYPKSLLESEESINKEAGGEAKRRWWRFWD